MWSFKAFWPCEQRKQKERERGYVWAYGKLVKEHCVKELESYCNIARAFNDYSSFEEGVMCAIRDYEKLKPFRDAFRKAKEEAEKKKWPN